MTQGQRKALDLGSQDLTVDQISKVKEALVSCSGGKGRPEELVMLSAKSKPYQFDSLDAFIKELGKLPNDSSYFYYTVTFGASNRASLYLDPDRPAKLVLEGEPRWVVGVEETLSRAIPKGKHRHKLHGGWGFLAIWAMVMLIAAVFLVAISLARGPEPLLILWVLLISGMLGAYLSIASSDKLNPANTLSFSKKRRPFLEVLLHFITIALGIISVIIVALLIEIGI